MKNCDGRTIVYKTEPVVAWHFIRRSMQLGYKDKRKVTPGEKVTMPASKDYEGLPMLCRQGMHASKSLANAASFSSAGRVVLTRVVLSGKQHRGQDKIAAEHRQIIGKPINTTNKKFMKELAEVAAKYGFFSSQTYIYRESPLFNLRRKMSKNWYDASDQEKKNRRQFREAVIKLCKKWTETENV